METTGGARIIGAADSCSAIRNYLCESFSTGPTIKSKFTSKSIDKEEQAIALRTYARKSGIWLDGIPKDWSFLAKGGESEVYLSLDNTSVYKAC